MSKVARGKILVAANQEESIPEGWAVDAVGNPTTDPKEALAGSLLPIGGAKGAALALIVEILSASLASSNYGFEASSFFTSDGAPPNIGQFFLIIDGQAFGGKSFLSRIEVLMTAISDQPGARLPGCRRFNLRETMKKEGIDVAEKYISYFRKRLPDTVF